MYTLHGYKLRGVFHGQNNVPVERQEVIVPDAPPGSKTKLELAFTHPKLQFICRLMFCAPPCSRHIAWIGNPSSILQNLCTYLNFSYSERARFNTGT